MSSVRCPNSISGLRNNYPTHSRPHKVANIIKDVESSRCDSAEHDHDPNYQNENDDNDDDEGRGGAGSHRVHRAHRAAGALVARIWSKARREEKEQQQQQDAVVAAAVKEALGEAVGSRVAAAGGGKENCLAATSILWSPCLTTSTEPSVEYINKSWRRSLTYLALVNVNLQC